MIVGLTPSGLFVRIPDWNIEGFLPKRALGDPSLSLAEHGFSFRSKRSRHRFGLGDAIAVVVSRADLDRREVELGLVPGIGGGPRQKRRAQGKRTAHRRQKGRR
jgi:ribonuclease R